MPILNFLARPRLTAAQLLVLAAVWLAATQNLPLWREVLATLPPDGGVHNVAFIGLLFLLLTSALLVPLALLAARPVVKPLLILLLLLAALCSYFMNAFGEVIDESMIVNAVQTDQREASELVGAGLLIHLLLQGLLPALLVYLLPLRYRSPRRELAQRGLLLMLALATLVGGIGLRFKEVSLWAREHRDVRVYMNPAYPIYSAVLYVRDQFVGTEKFELQPLGEDARRNRPPSARPRLVVLVVGETARADDFQLDGYARHTNPELAKTPGIISYPQAWSCGTSTAVSVPCMFSRLDRREFSRSKAERQENLLDVLRRAGIDVHWLDNNSGCKGVCARVAFEDLSREKTVGLCDAEGCHDEILLRHLDERLASDDIGQDRLIVLHQKGSHGPSYYRRYPDDFRRFIPDCRRDAVQHCSREEIVNAYDNTVVYTDHLLAGVIARLQQRASSVDGVMLYVSDHGESLGENGLYLHGMPYAVAPEQQKHIPLIAWFAQGEAPDRRCLDAGRARTYSHDNLFDSMLGLFDVKTKIYRPGYDLFRECREIRSTTPRSVAASP